MTPADLTPTEAGHSMLLYPLHREARLIAARDQAMKMLEEVKRLSEGKDFGGAGKANGIDFDWVKVQPAGSSTSGAVQSTLESSVEAHSALNLPSPSHLNNNCAEVVQSHLEMAISNAASEHEEALSSLSPATDTTPTPAASTTSIKTLVLHKNPPGACSKSQPNRSSSTRISSGKRSIKIIVGLAIYSVFLMFIGSSIFGTSSSASKDGKTVSGGNLGGDILAKVDAKLFSLVKEQVDGMKNDIFKQFEGLIDDGIDLNGWSWDLSRPVPVTKMVSANAGDDEDSENEGIKDIECGYELEKDQTVGGSDSKSTKDVAVQVGMLRYLLNTLIFDIKSIFTELNALIADSFNLVLQSLSLLTRWIFWYCYTLFRIFKWMILLAIPVATFLALAEPIRNSETAIGAWKVITEALRNKIGGMESRLGI